MTTFRNKRPSLRRVLEYFKANPKHSFSEAAEALGISIKTLKNYLQELKEDGSIRRESRWLVSDD